MFDELNLELELWADLGKTAEIWWRDDDAQKPSPALTQLLVLSKSAGAALALATIPEGAGAALVDELSGYPNVSVLQHGFNHQNHAPPGERKMELGWHRTETDIYAQLRAGYSNLSDLFGTQWVPVMVPPWNRVDTRLLKGLADLGLCGLSTLGPRERAYVRSGLKQVNVHVDIIDWKNGRCFVGEEHCIRQMVTHLSAKRTGQADFDEPTGLMSHHLVHDRDCWTFLAKLFNELGQRDSVALLDARACFAK